MANLTIGDVYISINEALQDYETEVVKATDKITEIKVITGERSEARAAIHAILDKNNIPIQDPTGGLAKTSSFKGTEIEIRGEKIRLAYKAKGNTGSGGGAEATKLTESAQCVYAAIAFGLRREITNADVTKVNVDKYKTDFDINGDINKILNELDDEWITSCVLGANKLWNKFNGKGKYVFHRGSKDVDKIEAGFKRVKKIEKVRMDVNKWNPSDIWMIESNFHWDCLDKEMTLVGYNQCIQENLEKDKLIGVSLKKIYGSADIKQMNMQKAMKGRCKDYVGYTYSNDSIDAYLNLSGGTKIQYRSFGGKTTLTGFQGELKGTKANQGKISLGPTNMILRSHGFSEVPTNAAARVKNEKTRGSVIDEIKKGLRTYTKPKMSDTDIAKLFLNTKIVTEGFLYSKLQATQLLDIVTNIKNTEARNQLVEDLYLYASSQSKYSSAYYKLQ